MPVSSLTQLANLYGSDKGTVGPSRAWSAHNYTDIYEAYLARDRYSEITLLEIGLGVVGKRWDAQIVQGCNTGGASLKMWYDYFPHARIFGIDLNPCSYLENDRIKTFVADQGCVRDLNAFIEATSDVRFDIIIDDGSHRAEDQQVSLSCLFRRVKHGGLYFIEDLANNGLGDDAKGRHACDRVLNTRRILKHFDRYGRFLEPNAFLNPGYLIDRIESVSFHVPEQRVKVVYQRALRRPFKRVRYYRVNSERLCAIRKTGSKSG